MPKKQLRHALFARRQPPAGRCIGALKTPHVYLFDGDMNLVYRGSIDDNVSDAEAVSERYVQDAIQAVANGKPVGVAETKAIGCSIKRVSK